MRKHVHFIGIAGHAMAPIAKMFKDMGWRVTGSDQKTVFPPITTYLKKNHIKFSKGYSPDNIKGKPDLVVVGRSALLVNKKNPEVVTAKKLDCPMFSYPEVLRDYLVRENSIVVVGTYGKSTSTALISWILEQAGLSPSFMIGGLPINFPDGVRYTSSAYSVLEGDEPPAMRETDPPKFMFYKPKFALLTAAKWDHPEIFRTEKEYIDAFIRFVKLIPPAGLLVACREGENNEKITKFASCPVVWYSLKIKTADFGVENISETEEVTRFEVVNKKGRILLETSLLGEHNLQDITGGVALCQTLGVSDGIIKEAVRTFKGVRARLENLGIFSGVSLFRDFAQHPAKVKEALSALRKKYSTKKIFCVFDPHASVLQQRKSLEWYPASFDLADQVIVTKVTFPSGLGKNDRVKGPEITKAIVQTQPHVFYEPVDQKVSDFLVRKSRSGDIISFMSSGGLRIERIIQAVKVQLQNR